MGPWAGFIENVKCFKYNFELENREPYNVVTSYFII